GPPDAADKALALMANRMGPKGLDLLYELSIGASKVRSKAEALLKQPEVRAKASPALAVALDLRAAIGCQAKKALLERATTAGDLRAVAILQPLTVGASKGCGFLSLASCPAQCAAEAQDMQRAIQAIRARNPG
ncbi:MAG: hypothetical protein IT373_30060, partial [Polyangiaceae bacterium]|nr:hypothetical protein [Polyangiaceae bacterium]